MDPPQDLYRLPYGGRGTAQGIFAGTIAAVLLTLLALVWGTTEWAAWRLGFQPALDAELWWRAQGAARWIVLAVSIALLGVSALLAQRRAPRALALGLAGTSLLVGIVGTLPIYSPFGFFVWALRYREVASVEPVIQTGLWLISVPAHFLVLVSVVVAVRRARRISARADTHGSADFADGDDVREAGLLSGDGVILGGFTEGGRVRFLTHDGPEHCLLFAPSRSGKGVSAVVPTLLAWSHSCVVFDPKGENWHRTAGWRQRELGSACIRVNPVETDPSRAARWNPLLEIQRGPLEVRDAQQVADILTSGETGIEDPHWRTTAADLLTGAILHVLYAGRDKSLPGVLALLSDPAQAIESTLVDMLETEHDPDGSAGWIDAGSGEPTRTHPVVAATARTMLNRSENERGSVLSTAIRSLALWRDFVVAENTRTSDFALTDLVQHDRPVSIYLCVPVSDLARTRAFTRLFFALAMRRLTESMTFDGEGAPRRVLLLLDEFPQLHHVPELESALPVIAGFGIKAFLVAQDLTQLFKSYGRNQAITGNCEVLVTFKTQNIDTARLVSEMAGTRTVHRETRTYTGNRLSPWLGHVMASEQETQRPLVAPDEVMRLPDDACLVFAGGKPIRGTKTPYYLDRELGRRAALAPPETSGSCARNRPSWPASRTARRGREVATTERDAEVESLLPLEPVEPEAAPREDAPAPPDDSDEGRELL